MGIEKAFTEAWFNLGLVYVRQGQRELADAARARLVGLKSDLASKLSQAIDKL